MWKAYYPQLNYRKSDKIQELLKQTNYKVETTKGVLKVLIID